MSDWETFNYQDRMKSRFTDYLKQKDQPSELFASFAYPLDTLEEVLAKIYLSGDIYSATGLDLDRFGEYVGEDRSGMSDDDYRAVILAKKFSSSGSGTELDITTLAAAITNGASVKFITHFPAAYVLHLSGENVPNTVNDTIQRASAAGVRSYVTHDYGTGAFALAGVDVSAGVALQVDANTAMQVDDDTALGVDRASAYIGGSRLASAKQIGDDGVTASLYVVAPDIEGDLINGDGAVITTGSADYDQGGTSNRLAGAFKKED